MSKSQPLPPEQDRMVQRYEAIEQPVLVWVISAARKCGLNLLGLRTGTVYAEAHKEVSLSTYDLQPLSDLIAKSKTRVEIPEEIARHLDEIIDLRTLVGAWYRSNTVASDSSRIVRNKTHRDRTTEWQQARKRLRHLYPAGMLNNPELSHSTNALSSPANKFAVPNVRPRQLSPSKHETKVEHKSIVTSACLEAPKHEATGTRTRPLERKIFVNGACPTDIIYTPSENLEASESHTMVAFKSGANIGINAGTNNMTDHSFQEKGEEDHKIHLGMSNSIKGQHYTPEEKPMDAHTLPRGSDKDNETDNESCTKLREKQNMSEQPTLEASASTHSSGRENESNDDNQSSMALKTKPKRKPNLKRKQKKKSKTKLKHREEALGDVPATIQQDGAQYILDRGATLQARSSRQVMQDIWGEHRTRGEGGFEQEQTMMQEAAMKDNPNFNQEAILKQEEATKEEPCMKHNNEDAKQGKESDYTRATGPASVEAVSLAGTAWATSYTGR